MLKEQQKVTVFLKDFTEFINLLQRHQIGAFKNYQTKEGMITIRKTSKRKIQLEFTPDASHEMYHPYKPENNIFEDRVERIVSGPTTS